MLSLSRDGRAVSLRDKVTGSGRISPKRNASLWITLFCTYNMQPKVQRFPTLCGVSLGGGAKVLRGLDRAVLAVRDLLDAARLLLGDQLPLERSAGDLPVDGLCEERRKL